MISALKVAPPNHRRIIQDRDYPIVMARLTAGSFGIVRVLVNGVETVVDGKSTDATPGAVLRSGKDTYTVATA